MFESSGFRRMVAPHLPTKPGGKALGLARDDDDVEGWEAMAMRDELTDVMLHDAFGDAILKEVSFLAAHSGMWMYIILVVWVKRQLGIGSHPPAEPW